MPQDQQTYKRAAAAALSGLAVQLIIAVAMALVGLWAKSPALHAATLHMFGGLPIWVILFLIYNQHRLERIEALDAERLAQTGRAGADMFGGPGDELRVARQRLDRLYKWGLGTVSFVVAICLLAFGSFWLVRYSRSVTASTFDSEKNIRVLLSLCIAIGFVAFILARYVAGMTRVKEWQLLRSGASYLMGNTVVSALVALAALLYWFEFPAALAWLDMVVPLLMVLIGTEIIVTFLLSAYRPRRPGEIARPAFDSRVLGLLTSPESIAKAVSEAINYQFGFEISRSWFYQLLSRAITPLVIFGIVVLVLISSFVVVDPHEEAIITRFGQFMGKAGPGLHWKLPWPISRARSFPVARVHQISVGSIRTSIDKSKPILWTTEHVVGGEEQYLITGAAPGAGADQRAEDPSEGKSVPGMALVAVDVIVQFRVKDLEAFARNVTHPRRLIAAMRQREDWARITQRWQAGGSRGDDPLLYKTPIDPCPVLAAIANRRVNAYCAKRDIDTLLTRGRLLAGHELRQRIQADVDERKLGLDIVFVGVAGIHPPQKGEVAAAFHEQVGALQERQSAVEKARREAIQQLAQVAGSQEQAEAIYEKIIELEQIQQEQSDLGDGQADAAAALNQRRAEQEQQINKLLTTSRGQAAEILYDALAYRWGGVIAVQAEANRYQARLEAYRRAPNYYKMRLHLDSLAEALKGARKIVISNKHAEDPEIRLDLQDTQTHLGSLLGR